MGVGGDSSIMKKDLLSSELFGNYLSNTPWQEKKMKIRLLEKKEKVNCVEESSPTIVRTTDLRSVSDRFISLNSH